jgi:hypothetical protein
MKFCHGGKRIYELTKAKIWENFGGQVPVGFWAGFNEVCQFKMRY